MDIQKMTVSLLSGTEIKISSAHKKRMPILKKHMAKRAVIKPKKIPAFFEFNFIAKQFQSDYQ